MAFDEQAIRELQQRLLQHARERAFPDQRDPPPEGSWAASMDLAATALGATLEEIATLRGERDALQAQLAEKDAALRTLLRAQGEIIPMLNDEYLGAEWVREIVRAALTPSAPSPREEQP